MTTVQDLPGRLGYWQVGVPPSGPMDPLSLREANLAVGNPPTAPGLEITATGPTLQFSTEAVVCVTGAPRDRHGRRRRGAAVGTRGGARR